MKRRTVYPVEGMFLQDVPAVSHLCDDPRCVDSGAFTTDKPPGGSEPAETPEPTEQVGSSDSVEE